MILDLLRTLHPIRDLYRAQWPTREPRPPIYDDGRPSVAQMIRQLPEVKRARKP